MVRLFKPSPTIIAQFIAREEPLDFNYPMVGATQTASAPPNFDVDKNLFLLSEGNKAWEAAKLAVQQWVMFPVPWTQIEPSRAPIQTNQTIAMLARVMGMWWINSCRIVYVIDEPNRFGFAYGTLPGHVEQGEELFLVERDDTGKVYYRLEAFSRPRHLLARLTYPLPRVFQKKFQRDSKAAMVEFVQKASR
ncbi:MAG: DUF1990 domain-containing protein [Saprospiraceae bacterium]|nr:DUF1990 domain-containing protein [Saprospiraceae bacterium]